MNQINPQLDSNKTVMGSLGPNNRAAPYDLSIGAVLSESWRRVHGFKAPLWGALGYFYLIFIGFFLLSFIVNMSLGAESATAQIIVAIISVICPLILFPLIIGIRYLAIRRAVDLPVYAKQIFGTYHYFWRLVGLLILMYVIALLMIFVLMFFIHLVPLSESVGTPIRIVVTGVYCLLGFGIFYVMFSFLFAPLLIVEKNMGVWRSFTASFFAFSQHWFKILVTFLFAIIIYLVSVALLFVGIIWTMPMLVNVVGVIYRNAFGVEEARSIH